MKNTLIVDIDTERKTPGAVVIGKPPDFPRPKSKEQNATMIIDDMACLCEALCTMIHLAEDVGVRDSSTSLRNCIKHLTDGFADASYSTIDVNKP